MQKSAKKCKKEEKRGKRLIFELTKKKGERLKNNEKALKKDQKDLKSPKTTPKRAFFALFFRHPIFFQYCQFS